MNYINPDAPAAGLTRLLNMRDNNPAMQLAYMPTKDIAAMDRMGAVEFNPYSGIPQARGVAAVAEGGSINEAPLSPMADELASRGRYGDSMLLHVRPDELQGLASLGTLTINPDTGLPEAFSFKSLLPVVGGIAGSFLLGPAFGMLVGKGALATGLAAGVGSFAGGLAAGQSPGQAALGGLLSGATAGFFSGAPAGIDPIGPGSSALASTPAELAAEGVTPGVLGTAGSTTAAQAGSTAAAAALPETVMNPATLLDDIPDVGLIPYKQSGAFTPTPYSYSIPAANKASITAQRLAALDKFPGPNAVLASDVSQAMVTNPPNQDVISSVFTAEDGLKSATNFDDVLPSTTNVERFARIDPKTYEAPNKFQQALGRKDFTGRDFITRQEYIDAGGRPDDIKLDEFLEATAKDPRTYLKGAASILMQPPPVPEFQELEPVDSGPSYVPRKRTLVGGQPRKPETTAEILARMTGGGDAQPLASQFRYVSEGGLVALQEGGIPTQGQPVVGSTVLEEQEKAISERARQDEIKERDKAMSRGQQFIQQPTGNEQLFKQMQVAGEAIGQQIAQGQQAYATPYGQKAPTESFNTGADFGFYQGGLVGLSNGGEVGNSIAERRVAVRDYLKSKGLRDEAVAGIMGNIEAEAPSYRHDQIEKTQKKVKGYGLFQFTGPRKTAYFNWLEKNNQTDSAESQIDYVMDHIYDTRGEMDKSEYDIGYGNRGKLRDAFKDGSVEDISKKFMLLFERPKDQSKEKIEFRQEQALNAFGRIPEPDKVSTPKAIVSAPPQIEEESALDKLASLFGIGDKSLKVGRGDTLSQIAEREGVSVKDIAEASGIQDINKIQAGQELTIPSQGLLSMSTLR